MAIPIRTGTAIDPTAITAAIDPTATIGHTLIMADLTATTVVPTAITVVQVSASPLASRPRADQTLLVGGWVSDASAVFVEQGEHGSMASLIIDVNESSRATTRTQRLVPNPVSCIGIVGELLSCCDHRT
jgi:hypothetical protein